MHGKGRRHTDKDIMVMYDAAKHDPAEYAPVNISFDFEMLYFFNSSSDFTTFLPLKH